MATQLSDQLLLKRYLKGDRDAFDTLYRRYVARVYATAFRLTGHWEDAEDTIQEVFVTLARKAGSIRRGQALASWLYRVTVNRATDCLRGRRTGLSLDGGAFQVARIIAVESLRRDALRQETHEREALLEQIVALIPRLPARQAAVFVLRGFQGLPHRQIGEILECSDATSKSHYSMACKRLRHWVKDQKDAETPSELRQSGEGRS